MFKYKKIASQKFHQLQHEKLLNFAAKRGDVPCTFSSLNRIKSKMKHAKIPVDYKYLDNILTIFCDHLLENKNQAMFSKVGTWNFNKPCTKMCIDHDGRLCVHVQCKIQCGAMGVMHMCIQAKQRS